MRLFERILDDLAECDDHDLAQVYALMGMLAGRWNELVLFYGQHDGR